VPETSSVHPRPQPTRAQLVTGAAALLCYAVGYPVALVAHSGVGWVFVSVGGVFLLALGVVTVRRIDRGNRSAVNEPRSGVQ
jgi:hypothetical protein